MESKYHFKFEDLLVYQKAMQFGEITNSQVKKFPKEERFRQFYVSLDLDLTKIETKSHILKTILTIFNTVKIPAPTFEINGLQGIKFHAFYF